MSSQFSGQGIWNQDVHKAVISLKALEKDPLVASVPGGRWWPLACACFAPVSTHSVRHMVTFPGESMWVTGLSPLKLRKPPAAQYHSSALATAIDYVSVSIHFLPSVTVVITAYGCSGTDRPYRPVRPFAYPSCVFPVQWEQISRLIAATCLCLLNSQDARLASLMLLSVP